MTAGTHPAAIAFAKRARRTHVAADAGAPKHTARMKPADRVLLWLVFLLICVSLIASLPQTLAMLRFTARIVPPGGELGFRLLREATLAVIILVAAVLIVGKRRRIIQGTFAIVAYLILSWVVIVAFWSVIVEQVPAPMALLGVRLLQYVPLISVGYLLTRSAGYPPLALFASLLRWYVLLQGLVAFYQVVGGTRLSWTRTIFGYRAFGTFASYNAFGPTMAACALVFCIALLWSRRIGSGKRFGGWMLFAGLLAATSGSRTAVLVSCSVIAYYQFATAPLNMALKRVLITLTPLVAVAFYYVANESALTGRSATSPMIQDETRITIWSRQLKGFETADDIVFGLGLGEGVSAGAWLKGRALGAFTSTQGDRRISTNPHSAYISLAASFGLVGLLGYLTALGLTLVRAPRAIAALFVIVLASLSVPFGILEIFPANALLLFLWGCILGSTAWWHYDKARRPQFGMDPDARNVT